MVAVGLAGHLSAGPALRPATATAAVAAAPTLNPLFLFSFPVSDGPVINRFTLDDVVPAWSAPDTGQRRGRRLGGISNYRTDPYER